MSDWQMVTDDEWTEQEREAIDALTATCREFGAATVEAIPRNSEGVPLAVYSVLDECEVPPVGVVVRIRDGGRGECGVEVVWGVSE